MAQSRSLVTRVRSVREGQGARVEMGEKMEKVVIAATGDTRHSDNNNVSVTSL